MSVTLDTAFTFAYQAYFMKQWVRPTTHPVYERNELMVRIYFPSFFTVTGPIGSSILPEHVGKMFAMVFNVTVT